MFEHRLDVRAHAFCHPIGQFPTCQALTVKRFEYPIGDPLYQIPTNTSTCKVLPFSFDTGVPNRTNKQVKIPRRHNMNGASHKPCSAKGPRMFQMIGQSPLRDALDA